MEPAQGTRLDSWKAIADYLRRDVRTVTRWAKGRDMPVHRVPGGKRGAIFAFSSEIDAWLTDQNGTDHGTGGLGNGLQSKGATAAISGEITGMPGGLKSIFPQSTNWRIGLTIASLVLAVAATSGVLHSIRGQNLAIASVQYGIDSLEGKAADGRTLWAHKYSQTLVKDYFTVSTGMLEGFRITDFWGDGGREVAAVVPMRTGPNPYDADQAQIDFFTSGGKLLWSYLPDRAFQFGEHELKAPWSVHDLLVTKDGGRQTIWVTAAHHTWGNSFVVQLDPQTGKDTLRYVNTGNIRRLRELKTAYGTYLLAGGFNNEWDSGALAIVNEEKAFAASPQTAGTRHRCNSCPPGDPDYYFVFPRSELNRVMHAYEDSVYEILLSGDGIEITKHEGFGAASESTVYLLQREPPFSVLSLRYNSDYDMIHRSWSSEGKLPHSLENCPERLHPQPVRLWTPAAGWTELPVRPARADQ